MGAQMVSEFWNLLFNIYHNYTGNGDQGDQGDQGNQADNQGNGTSVPVDIPGQPAQGNPQTVEPPENSKKLPTDFSIST